MNDPAKQHIDVEEQREWLKEHMRNNSLSWSDIARSMNESRGKISSWGGGTYKGDQIKVAEAVYRYRQMLRSQAQLEMEAPEVPGYFETPTSNELMQLMRWAQRGRIVLAAMAAGMGKTSTAKHFAACFPNVFMATMSPSTAGVQNMQMEVLEAMGERDAVGTPQALSRRIKKQVQDLTNPVIILDEVQHLSEKSFEEIRSWHDATGVGIALLGNPKVFQTLEGGSRKEAYAQLFSRISLPLPRNRASRGDAEALADAWNITGEAEVEFIYKIAKMPGALRGATAAIEIAHMLAQSRGEPLAVAHIQDSWAQLTSRGNV